MHILVVTPHYPPDGGPSAPLFGLLCEEMARQGHPVSVIAAVPHYPSGQVYACYRQGWLQTGVQARVDVIRVRIPSLDRSRLAQRLVQFLAYQLGATVAGLRQRYDVLFVTNPALITVLPFAVLGMLRRKPAIFSVYDVYPQVGVELGIFRHRLVERMVAGLERYCLLNARYVHVLTSSFLPALIGLGVPADKLATISVWIDTDFVRPLPRGNAFSAEHGLNDSFVVLYAGNIGLSQGLEHVLAAAQQVAGRAPVQFVFVGEGAGREALLAKAQAMQLSNVRFIPFQPRERVPEVLATADVALVSLQPQIAARSLPSKTISYLASERPILAVVDEGSDTWNLVERAGAGLCVPPGEPECLAEAVLRLHAAPDLCRQMAAAGRAYAEQHHSHHQAARQFLALLERAIQGGTLERSRAGTP